MHAARKPIIVMGIESSCDETAIAVVHEHDGVLAHQLHSQIDIHQAWGGVVPELASRDHCLRILPLWQAAMRDSQIDAKAIDAIAYTCGPGLAGSLMMGATFAITLGHLVGKPIFPIHHLEGHILSAVLPDATFPALILLVSGGHTMIIEARGHGMYAILGETLDDAVGEAFDKTAKLLHLPYPGGPHIEALAKEGVADAFKLPRPMLHDGTLNMSFSGLKTAVLHAWKACDQNQTDRANLAASFQSAVCEVLTKKMTLAMAHSGIQQTYLCGGVAANHTIRSSMSKAVTDQGGQLCVPPLSMSTDNGIMIAYAGLMHMQQGFAALASDQMLIQPRFDLVAYTSEWCVRS